MKNIKVIWKVAEQPTGLMAIANKRGWPSAQYNDGKYAASIHCSSNYYPADVKTGNHPPVTLKIADYSMPDGNCPWTRRTIGQFKTLKEAKAAFAELLKTNHKITPHKRTKWPENYKL